MSSWSFQLEGKIFDGVEIVPMSHVYVKDKILNPDPRVCRSVVCLYIHGFKSLWKFMIQHLIGESTGGARHPCTWMCHGMLSTIVVFGVDSELVFDQYDHFGGRDPTQEHVLWICRWTWSHQPFL